MVKGATADKKAKRAKEQKVEVNKKYVDRIEQSGKFEPFRNKSARGNRIIRLKRPGETVRGYLGTPFENFHESSTYPIKLAGTNEVIEIPTNKQLARLVKKGDCFGQLVEIEYRGRQYTYGGHYRKIYRLFIITKQGAFSR